MMITNTHKIAAAATFGVLCGAALGYFASQKVAEEKFRKIAEEEIKSVKERYAFIKGESKESEEAHRKLFNEYNDKISKFQYEAQSSEADKPEGAVYSTSSGSVLPPEEFEINKLSEEDPPEELMVVNESVEDNLHGITQEELDSRNPDVPYIISVDEFMEEKEDYSKHTVTYYEDDDSLTDEREQLIPDKNGTVGVDNLYHFGKGSKDANIVYVRNDRREADFEVVRETGSYRELVLGFVPPKDKRKTRKMRDDE